MDKIRVVIAEDHHVVRAAIAALLDSEPDIEIIGDISSGHFLLPKIAELLPDVLLLDAHMPGHRVIDSARWLHQNLKEVRILILSAHERREYVYGLLKEGVMGYVLKDDAPEKLVQAIRSAAKGEEYLSPRIAHMVLRATQDNDSTLTSREAETLFWMAKGMSNDQIAKQMVVTTQTVRNYVRRLFIKLNATSRVDAVLIAIHLGLVPGPNNNI